MKRKTIKISALLFILVLIEVTAHDILLDHLDTKIASLIYLISGLAIGIVVLLPTNNNRIPSIKRQSKYFKNFLALSVLLMFVIGLPFVASLYDNHPIDYKIADMLPIMDIMVERFMSGENPYKIIPEIWGGMQPIYLPAMWLPCLLYTSPSPRDATLSRMPSSA